MERQERQIADFDPHSVLLLLVAQLPTSDRALAAVERFAVAVLTAQNRTGRCFEATPVLLARGNDR